MANNLVSNNDEHELEVGMLFLHIFDNRLNNVEFLLDRYWLSFIVKEASTRVAKLNNKDILSNARINIST